MFILIILPAILSAQTITLINSTNSVTLIEKGVPNDEFISSGHILGCSMPHLFIYNDTSHNQYQLLSVNSIIQSIQGKYLPVNSRIQCQGNNCNALLSNGCGGGRNQMNWIIVNTNTYKLQYLVNCAPQSFYKPFQWGLFLLVCFCSVAITLSSLYSRAWSLDNFGINVNEYFIIIFNLLFVVGSILAYFIPSIISLSLKIVGTVVGIIGVTICMGEIIWLAKSNTMNTKVFLKVRILDLISVSVGTVVTVLYWLSNGNWIINDILAVCMIVAGIKVFKIRSLRMGIFMLLSLLLIQIAFGLVVHYFMGVSYNNLVINLFQSPLVIVFPSITPQLYRKCAWLPVTNLIFPGLFISYLRRFDKARGTVLYLIIGYVSFYIGSVAWIFVDMMTIHALPLAILSDAMMILGVCVVANRRNQLKTMMKGLFFDPEMPDMSEELLPSKSERISSGFQQLTSDLRIDKQSDAQI